MTPFRYISDEWLLRIPWLLWIVWAGVVLTLVVKRKRAITKRSLARALRLLVRMMVLAVLGAMFLSDALLSLLFRYDHGYSESDFSLMVSSLIGLGAGMLVHTRLESREKPARRPEGSDNTATNRDL